MNGQGLLEAASAVDAITRRRRSPVRRTSPRWAAIGWTACSTFALLLAIVSTLGPHRVWGATAAVGYGVAALLAYRRPRSWDSASAFAAVAGSVAAPLFLLVAQGAAQLEVDVVERSGELLLEAGSPYVEVPLGLEDYNPYLPGMAIFGVPYALWGDGALTDARPWFAAVFLVSMAAAARIEGPRRPRSSARSHGLLRLAAFPAVALPLAVGGIDLPVIGLMCLGLALACRGSAGRAGLAVGAAAALKWTAWPLLPVVLVLVAATRGGRCALRSAGAAAAVLVLAVMPVLAAHPHAFVEHLVLFPLGEGDAPSPSASPLPGHLLATYVPGGSALALAALAAAALAMGITVLVHPPRTVIAAADRLALGLGLAMCLAPATRFGYVVYPLLLAGWFRLTHRHLSEPGGSMHTSSRYRTGTVPTPA
ncbi:glycosyltransferase 87 family protein [Streptomyces sp. 8N706]|uniref:glycosyltransferase 87 family protein n=1 Tax=Streptomyces sp. 8N706 TaxID=3457416 RepID=UPI003FD23854